MFGLSCRRRGELPVSPGESSKSNGAFLSVEHHHQCDNMLRNTPSMEHLGTLTAPPDIEAK
jgi:hypothetical protein